MRIPKPQPSFSATSFLSVAWAGETVKGEKKGEETRLLYKVNHSLCTFFTFLSFSPLPNMVSKPMIVFGKAERDHAEMIWVCQKRELRIRPMIIQYLLLPVLYNFDP